MAEETPVTVPAEPPVAVAEEAPVLPSVYGYAPHQGYYQAPATPAYVHAAPVHQPTNYYAPGYYQAPIAPVVAPAPVAAVTPAQSSQFHAQSELGEYNYGYSNANSAKQEFKTADGKQFSIDFHQGLIDFYQSVIIFHQYLINFHLYLTHCHQYLISFH